MFETICDHFNQCRGSCFVCSCSCVCVCVLLCEYVCVNELLYICYIFIKIRRFKHDMLFITICRTAAMLRLYWEYFWYCLPTLNIGWCLTKPLTYSRHRHVNHCMHCFNSDFVTQHAIIVWIGNSWTIDQHYIMFITFWSWSVLYYALICLCGSKYISSM